MKLRLTFEFDQEMREAMQDHFSQEELPNREFVEWYVRHRIDWEFLLMVQTYRFHQSEEARKGTKK